MSQFIQRFVRAPVQLPFPHDLAYRFCGFATDGRIKSDEKTTMAVFSFPEAETYSPRNQTSAQDNLLADPIGTLILVVSST